MTVYTTEQSEIYDFKACMTRHIQERKQAELQKVDKGE